VIYSLALKSYTSQTTLISNWSPSVTVQRDIAVLVEKTLSQTKVYP
jgi:hypothetical protein